MSVDSLLEITYPVQSGVPFRLAPAAFEASGGSLNSLISQALLDMQNHDLCSILETKLMESCLYMIWRTEGLSETSGSGSKNSLQIMEIMQVASLFLLFVLDAKSTVSVQRISEFSLNAMLSGSMDLKEVLL